MINTIVWDGGRAVGLELLIVQVQRLLIRIETANFKNATKANMAGSFSAIIKQ